MAFSQPQPVLLGSFRFVFAFVVCVICSFYSYDLVDTCPCELAWPVHENPLLQPVYANVIRYRPPVPFGYERPAELEDTRSRIQELQRQAYTQAQIIREQSNMLAMALDPRVANGYFYPNNPRIAHARDSALTLTRPRRIPPLKKKEVKVETNALLLEKRTLAKQFKTFIRTHFTVRAAFRLIPHFLTKEERDKFLSETDPYLTQFIRELQSSSPETLVAHGLARSEQPADFSKLSHHYLRSVMSRMKTHPNFVDSPQTKENEENVEISLTEKHEGRVGFCRLIIFAISSFGAEGNTRLHQVVSLLRKLEIDVSEDPELISQIMQEADMRANNYQIFCSAKVLPPQAYNSTPIGNLHSLSPSPSRAFSHPHEDTNANLPSEKNPTHETHPPSASSKNNNSVGRLSNTAASRPANSNASFKGPMLCKSVDNLYERK